MVNLTKRGSTLIVKSDQSFPFEAGEITLPMNSLYFIIDESDAVVFRSVANSDIIFNALLKDLQIDGTQATKDNLVQLFDSVGNAVPSGGGTGGGAVDSVNGKTGAVYLTANDVNAYSKKEIDDKGFLTAVPDNYATDDEVTAAVADKVTKSELDTAIQGVEGMIPDTSNLATKNELNVGLEAKADKTAIADMATQSWVSEQDYATNTLVDSKLDKNTYNEDKKTFALKSELVDNVFDATELFTASQKPTDRTVTEEFQTAILAAISEKKVMVIHNGEVNVVVTFAQKKDSSVMFTATNNMQLFYIQLNTLTREVSIDMKAVGTGTFDKYSNEQNHSIFDLTRESTNNDIQVAFSTDNNGVKIPDVGDVVEVKDIDENITDSAIVISHINTADNIDLIFVKNNIVDDFIVTFNLKINYNAAQGFDSMRVLRSTHYEINLALITDAEMQALKGKIENKQDKLIGTEVEGQNLKTINGQSLLGTGNIEITSGGGQGGAVDSVNGQTGNVVITAADLDVYTKGEIDNKNYLTSIPDEYTTDAELSAALAGKVNTSDIADMATKTWVNGEKFLKEIPSEYITETELAEKNYATKSEIPTAQTTAEGTDKNYVYSNPKDPKFTIKSFDSIFENPKVGFEQGYPLGYNTRNWGGNILQTVFIIPNATQSKSGVMSIADKIKLDSIPEGGGGSSVTVDAELSTESENPVQNKIITAELNKKVESIELTQEEYDQLPTKDPNVMYVITDAPEVALKSDLANLATKEELNSKANTSDLIPLNNAVGQAQKDISNHQKEIETLKTSKADASAIVDMATMTWVNEQINAAIAQVNEKITEINNKIV